VTPFHRQNIEAMVAFGLPRVLDLNDLDQDLGAAANPVNIVDGVRFNAAFGYLDPVRDRPNLTVVGDVLCDRLHIEGERVVGARVVIGGRPETVRAARVVLSAGVYGSPAILLRSGIGDPAELDRIGIASSHALPGVGKNLHDHPGADLCFAGTDELVARSRAFASTRFHPEEQMIAKLRTATCPAAFDLHLYPVGGARRVDPDAFEWSYRIGLLTPAARGSVSLRSADPTAAPVLDHAFLQDDAGADLARLVEGIELLEAALAYPELARLLGDETFPGPALRAASSTRDIVRQSVAHCYHPVGTCKMGPAADPAAVVDANGQLHGLDGCLVADASIMPTVPRGNTHLPAVLVGERIAAHLAPR
jgi:choline dehydrogenase